MKDKDILRAKHSGMSLEEFLERRDILRQQVKAVKLWKSE